MKKIYSILIVLVLVLFAGNIYAQDINWNYVTSFGGNYYEDPVATMYDQSGDIIHSGTFSSDVLYFNGDSLSHGSGDTYGEQRNSYILKYSSDSSKSDMLLKWGKGFTGNMTIDLKTTFITGNNNYLASGFFYDVDTVTYGSTYEMYGRGDENYFMANLDSDVTMNWSKVISVKADSTYPQLDYGHQFIDSLGNIYISGSFEGDTLDLSGSNYLPGTGNYISQVFVTKYDQTGNLQWAFTDSSFNDDYGGTRTESIVKDQNSNIILGAQLPASAKTFIAGDTLSSSGMEDFIIVKIDDNGNAVSAESFGGNDDDVIHKLAVDHNNNYYAMITMDSDTFSIDGQKLQNDGYPDHSQGYLLKFDSNGNLEWYKKLGYDSYPTELKVNQDNEVYIVSSFANSSLSLGSTTLYSHGNTDILFAKYSSAGNLKWAKNIGGPEYNVLSDVKFSFDEKIYYTGELDTTQFIVENDTINKSGLKGFYTGIMNKYGTNTHLRMDTTTKTESYYDTYTSEQIWPGVDSTFLVAGRHENDSITLAGDTLNFFGNFDMFLGELTRSAVTTSPDTTIEGTIYDSSGTGITSGEVELFKVIQSGSYPKVDSVELSSDSAYKFDNLSASKYLVRYIPDTSNNPMGISTYYGSSVSWQNAMVLDVDKNGSYTGADINLTKGATLNGTSSISGTIMDQSGMNSDAVRLASVILTEQPDKDYSQEIVAYAATNMYSDYAFEDVNTDSYEIMVDIPGMVQDSVHALSAVQTQHPDYDYTISNDTIYVKGVYLEGNIYTWYEQSVDTGIVELYKIYQSKSKSPFLIMVDTVQLRGDNHYKFDSLERDFYMIRALPDTSSYPGFMPTYYGNSTFWEAATLINTSQEGSMEYANIYLMEDEVGNGNAVISGSVTDTLQNTVIEGESVLLFDVTNQQTKEKSQHIAHTYTDNSGMYKFSNVDTGDYFVLVDMPGKLVDSVHAVDVTSGQDQYMNRNFIYQNDTIYVAGGETETASVSFIEGEIFLSNEQPVNNGTVELYEVVEEEIYPLKASIALDGNNSYRFDSLEVGNYLVRAIPDENEFPDGIYTYSLDALSWENAQIFAITSDSSHSGSDVYIQLEPDRAGEATISGSISTVDGGKKNSRKQQNIVGKPVKSVSIVLIGKGEEGEKALINAVAQTTTDENGEYSFENVEPGDYSIKVDMPGAYQDSSISLTVTQDQFVYSRNNYVLDGNMFFVEEGFIRGNVYDVDENPMMSGYVKIFDFNESGQLPLVDSVGLNEGAFMSNGIPAGEYLVKVFPDKEEYPDYIDTYYEQFYSWKEATPVSVALYDTTGISIMPILVEEPAGEASIEGYVGSEDVKVYKSTDEVEITGKPVKSVSVVLVGKGEEKAGGDIIASTETNDEGIYIFENIEEGSYGIELDLPGVDQDSSYNVNVTSETSSYENYDYVLQGDTIYVDETSNPTFIGETETLAGLKIYPNPASEYVYVTNKEAEIHSIRLYNVDGRLVNTIEGNNRQTIRMDVNTFKEGLYLMKVRTSKGEKTMKVVFGR